MTTLSNLTHLDWLESEAIHILREVAGQCSNPVLLFSGGKDSLCLLRLAEKAFRPGRFPFPLLHIDTGHNYDEVIQFRDLRAKELNERLIVRSLEDSMKRGTVVLKTADEPRNKHQSVTLLEAIAEFISRDSRKFASIFVENILNIVEKLFSLSFSKIVQ
mgnify:CR=1 FL=1